MRKTRSVFKPLFFCGNYTVTSKLLDKIALKLLDKGIFVEMSSVITAIASYRRQGLILLG